MTVSPLPLEPEGVPEGAGTAPQQLPLVTPVESIPVREQLFAAAQLRFPLLPPIGAQAARHDDADERDQPEVRPGEQLLAAGNQGHKNFQVREDFGARILESCVCSRGR